LDFQNDDLGFSRPNIGIRYSMNSDQQQTDGAGMIEALAWLEVNKKRLAIGAIVVLVVGFGVYVYNYAGEQKEIKASAALIALKPAMTGSTNEPPVPASAYLKVAQEHAGTTAAERALLLAGGAYFTEGKYSEAQAQFDRLIKEQPSSKWAPDAAFGFAASLESQGKRDEALPAYQRVVTAYPSSSVVAEARLALARIYEAKNQPAEALKQYEELTRPGAMSMRSQDAVMRRSQLLKAHPELEKPSTNSLPAMSPVVSAVSNAAAATKTAIASTNLTPMTNKPVSVTNTPAATPKQ
jgi:TolA-binding protein